jgi:hypothetical protein
VELDSDPDPILAGAGPPVISSDSWILDRCGRWVDLLGPLIREGMPDTWVLDLGRESGKEWHSAS